jgi:hypothetical protein
VSTMRLRPQLLAGVLALSSAVAGASEAAAGSAFVERFRAAAAAPGGAALGELAALPFLYEGRRLGREAFVREVVPALFTPSVRRCLQRAPAQAEGDRLVVWCKPYGFHLGPTGSGWRLIEFVADVD